MKGVLLIKLLRVEMQTTFPFSSPLPPALHHPFFPSFHSSGSQIPTLTRWHMSPGTKSLPPYGSSPADCLSPTPPLLPQGFTEAELCRTCQSTCHWQRAAPLLLNEAATGLALIKTKHSKKLQSLCSFL